MKDKEFLTWVHTRVSWTHSAMPPMASDDLLRLKAIIDRTPDDQDTCIGGEAKPDISTLITSFYLIYRTHRPFKEIGDILNLMNKRMDKIEKG